MKYLRPVSYYKGKTTSEHSKLRKIGTKKFSKNILNIHKDRKILHFSR